MLTVHLIEQVEARGDVAELVRLAAYSESLFVDYTNQVPVIFAYKRADNEENQRRGIVGQNSGYRQGVRNQNYVPAEHHAGTASAEPVGSTITYYDLGRQAWRSYRRGNLISISAFWSEELQQFVDTPEEAGITRGLPFQASPQNSRPAVDEARASRTAGREAGRRQREAERQNYRTNDRSAREERRRDNLVKRSSR
jgi:hypothetical protein